MRVYLVSLLFFIFGCYSIQIESTKQKNLEESLNPNVDDWNIVSNLACRTFVSISEESRKKGAGGGDDND